MLLSQAKSGGPLSWRVKGKLFLDYVKTMRAHKNVSWTDHIHSEDLRYLSEQIDQDAWYPMEAYERMGLAIFKLIADGDLNKVRNFGGMSVDWLTPQMNDLLVAGDNPATVRRFQQYRQSFFDFPALEVVDLQADRALLSLAFRMSPAAEQAACIQTQGFLVRLLERVEATPPESQFLSKAWEGDARTLLELRWQKFDRLNHPAMRFESKHKA